MQIFSRTQREIGMSRYSVSEHATHTVVILRWSVALSTRSGPQFIFYPMGRETVLTPVQWNIGEFPVFTNVSGTESGPLPAQNKAIVGSG